MFFSSFLVIMYRVPIVLRIFPWIFLLNSILSTFLFLSLTRTKHIHKCPKAIHIAEPCFSYEIFLNINIFFLLVTISIRFSLKLIVVISFFLWLSGTVPSEQTRLKLDNQFQLFKFHFSNFKQNCYCSQNLNKNDLKIT